MVSVAVMHTMTKNSLGKKGFLVVVQVTAPHLENTRQELGAESMQLGCLLAWSQTHTQLLFLYNPNSQPRDSTMYNGLEAPESLAIKKMPCRHVHRTI